MSRPWCSSPGFNHPQKVKMDSISVLQLGEQVPVYTRKPKSNQSGYWIFLVLCLFFYKYPQVLSGA